jgi:N-acetylglucosamine-6-phosphate deacetylase
MKCGNENGRKLSATLIIQNARIILPTQVISDGYLVIDSGKISAVGEGYPSSNDSINVFDARGNTVMPGFIDLHVHGGGGGSFMSKKPLEHITARKFHAEHGTTSMQATTSTTDFRDLLQVVAALSKSSAESSMGSKVLGIHTEGPFISTMKPGAHLVPLLLNGDILAMNELIQAADDFITMVTLAPEIPGGFELLSYLTGKKIVASVGHTNATYAQVVKAVELGARSATHTFNAMSPLGHREPGAVGGILDSEEIYAEAILDGVHIDEVIFRILLACKGADQINLVTDATALAGKPNGIYPLDALGSLEKTEGKVVLYGTDTLAGSVLDMNSALKNCAKFSSVGLSELSKLSSLNAAKIIGKELELGSLEVGKLADLVLLDSELTVYATMIDGEWEYMNPQYEDNLVTY